MSDLQLDPDLIATLAALQTHRVEFVLVGDVANAIYDHGGFVSGIAVVPGGYGRNVERLHRALDALNAELGLAGRPDPRGLDWRRMDLRELAPCSFMTTHADIDVDFQPAGTDGYRDLFQDAARIELGRGAEPHIASPEDLERLAHGGGPSPAVSLTPAPAPEPAHEPVPPALAPTDLPAATLAPAPEDFSPEDEIRAAMARAGY